MLEAWENHAYKPPQRPLAGPLNPALRLYIGVTGFETLMKMVKSVILAGLLAFAPAMAMTQGAFAQDNAAAATAVPAPAAAGPAESANATEAAPVAKVAAPPRMKPTIGIGMPQPGVHQHARALQVIGAVAAR